MRASRGLWAGPGDCLSDQAASAFWVADRPGAGLAHVYCIPGKALESGGPGFECCSVIS